MDVDVDVGVFWHPRTLPENTANTKTTRDIHIYYMIDRVYTTVLY